MDANNVILLIAEKAEWYGGWERSEWEREVRESRDDEDDNDDEYNKSEDRWWDKYTLTIGVHDMPEECEERERERERERRRMREQLSISVTS